MANPVFPVVPGGVDSSQYQIEKEDPSLQTPLEGGYVASRPRHTRRPRNTWTVGYTMVLDSDKLLIEAFYDTVHGGSQIFDWTNPETGVVWQVRFVGSVVYKYQGIGFTKLWTVVFKVQEA